MPIGDHKATYAAYETSLGRFDFWVNEGSYDVTATRLDAHTWTVTTDDLYVSGAGDVAVNWVPVKHGTTLKTYYHLPFQATVTCPTCVAPL